VQNLVLSNNTIMYFSTHVVFFDIMRYFSTSQCNFRHDNVIFDTIMYFSTLSK
jgi:hypothetical protein